MYVERLPASSVFDGEVVFFPPSVFGRRSMYQGMIPDTITLARQNLMNIDQAAETIPVSSQENQPAILRQTREALNNLYIKAVFQKNGSVAGSCLRIQSEMDGRVEKIPSPVLGSIQGFAINQIDPHDALGNRFTDRNYVDDQSLVYALANLRQATGSLETGNKEADLKIPEQFRNLNGRLFDLNRAGGNHSVLEDLNLAVRLKQAFPEKASQVDVSDVHYSAGGVMKGHAGEIAEIYLQRAIKGQIFSPALVDQKSFSSPDYRNLTRDFHPRYQTELFNGYQLNLGSAALAAAGILRFLADFDPDFAKKNQSYNTVLDRAQSDLDDLQKRRPDILQDPQMVLLFGEHLANIQVVKKTLTGVKSLPDAKIA